MLKRCLWTLVVCLGLNVAALGAAPLRDSVRYPVAPVPKLQQAPTIDGTVDKREWYGASLLPQLTEYDAAIAGSLRSKVYIAYSDTHLYLAFQFQRPSNALAPKARAQGRNETAELFQDDCFGLWLDLQNDWSSDYFFGGNANSAFWDRKENNGHGDFAWNPDWQYQARATDSGWEGEIALPFAALAAQTPKPGEVWGFDLYNHQRTPFGALLTGINRSDWWGRDGLMQVVFTGKPVAVRFVESGPFASERVGGAVVEIVNLSEQPVQVAADMQFYRRKAGAAGGSNNFLAAIVSGTQQTGMDAVKDMKLDGLVKDALSLYDPQESLEPVPTSMTVAPGRSGNLRIAARESAEYLLIHKIQLDGELLSGRALPFLLPPPILVKLDPYLLTAQLLVAKVKLSEVEGWSAGSSLRLSLREAAGDKVVASAELPYSDAPELEAPLSLKETKPGDYLLRVEVVDAQGKVRATRDEAYARPAPPVWHANNLGRSVAVPKPWTPVTVQGSATDLSKPLTIGVWGRSYVIGSQPGFEQITTQGQPLFAAPMRLSGKIAGQPVQWKCTARQIAHQADDAVEVRSQYTAGNVALTWITRFEFDGFVKINYQLNGQASDSIDELFVDVTYRPESATLYAMDQWLRREQSGPDRTGAMPKPGQTIEHRITQTSWVGNPDYGLMANFQNDRDWSYSKKGKAIEVTPGEKQTLYRLRLIDKPTAMTRPRDIEFSLMATPVKPRPENYGDYRFLQIAGLGNASRWDEMCQFVDECKENDIKYIIAHSGWNEYHVYDIFGWPEIPTPELEDHLKKLVAYAHSKDMQVIFYVGWYISMNCQDWNPWGTEMLRSPAETGGYKTMVTVFNNAYNDAEIYRIAEIIDRVGFDGIFWDSTLRCAASDSLYRPGEGWLDDNGQRQPTFPIWATRDLMKRLWVLLKHEKRQDGIFYAGNPGVPFMPVQSFNDVHHPGEGPEMRGMPGELHSKYSPAFGMARNMGEPYGIVTEKTVKGSLGFNALMAVNLPHNMTGKAHTGSLMYPKHAPLLRGKDMAYGRHQHSAIGIYNARKWVDVGSAQWLPYWRNADYLQVSPADLTLASMHLQPGQRALLVVSNLAAEGRDLTVRLNRQKLGFAPDQPLYVYDALIESRQYELQGDSLTLPIENERYRLLMISAQALDRAKPIQTVGEDLLQGAGSMESADAQGGITGWKFHRHTEQGPVFSLDQSQKRSGQASLRIERSDSVQSAAPVIATFFAPVKPNTRYMVRGYIRGEKEMGVHENQQSQGVTIGVEGKPAVWGLFVGDYTGNQWVESHAVFESGDNTTVPLQVRCYGTGAIWVDDVELLEVAR